MTIDASYAWLLAIAVAMPAAIVGAVLNRARRYIRATTLVAPWAWAVMALVAIVTVEMLALVSAGEGTPRWLGAARYMAAMATFCPIMAVLGAKRPQEKAWHLIVLALWFVLALPALQDVVYHYGQRISLDAAWRGFVLVLIGVGLVNYLPTRFWPSSVLYAAAQTILLADYLPLPEALALAPPWRVPVALTLFAGAGLLPRLGWPRRGAAKDPLDRLWRDFRDAYGMLWAVRVGMRADEAGHAIRSTTALGNDVAPPTERASESTVAVIESRLATERTFLAHLQRFVSRAWIDQRLAGDRSSAD